MINIRKNLVEEGKWGIKCPFPMQPKFVVIHNTANDAPAENEIAYMRRNDNGFRSTTRSMKRKSCRAFLKIVTHGMPEMAVRVRVTDTVSLLRSVIRSPAARSLKKLKRMQRNLRRRS